MSENQKNIELPYEEPKIHNFQEDLEWSEVPAQYVNYMRSINHFWPKAKGWDRILDLLKQKKGNDVVISLPDGSEVRIQFKSRRAQYNDLCIEFRHDYYNGYVHPGWIEIPSEADYLLYLVPAGNSGPACVCKIDYRSLHAAWEENKEEWLQSSRFFHPDAHNDQYITRNIAIPWDILLSAGVIVDRFVLPPDDIQA